MKRLIIGITGASGVIYGVRLLEALKNSAVETHLILSNAGAQIYPPAPAFYHGPETIDDIVNQSVGKLLDYFEISHDLFKRWDNTHIQKKERNSRS